MRGWAAVRGQRVVPLGPDRFGQSGDLPDLYAEYGLDADAILEACAQALLLTARRRVTRADAGRAVRLRTAASGMLALYIAFSLQIDEPAGPPPRRSSEAAVAAAATAQAVTQLNKPELNLARTEVRSPVEG